MSTENVIGDVEAFKRDARERAAMLFYDANQALKTLVHRRGPITPADLGTVSILLADALVLLESGGVATPRLPTEREMDR
ncbi:MAG TPA: hypothetical protein VK176_11640 [Phycisphaerales bacterium]|nr:hypothetical protein [Phycisphaerales bacterium]